MSAFSAGAAEHLPQERRHLSSGDDSVSVDRMVDAIKIELGERKMKFLEGNKAALVAGMEAAKA